MRAKLRGVTAGMLALLTLAAGTALRAQEQKPAKMKASAIKVEMIHADEIKLPADFQGCYLTLTTRRSIFRVSFSSAPYGGAEA